MKYHIVPVLALSLFASALTTADETKKTQQHPPVKQVKQEVSPAMQKQIKAVEAGDYWAYEDYTKEDADVNAFYAVHDTLLSRKLESALRGGRKYDGPKS